MPIGSEGGIERQEVMSPMRKRFLGIARAVLDILESRGQLDRDLAEAVAVAITQPSSIDARLTPLLDLSPEELGSEKISEYFKAHGIVFANQTLSFSSFDGQPLEMNVGPKFVAGDFYFLNGGKDLSIVFARLEGGNVTVRFDDGAFAGLYDSDETGKPIYQSIE